MNIYTYAMLVAGLVTLIIGGEIMVRGSVGIARKLKLSSLVIGLTVVAFGTSAPELMVSINAALDGHPDISMGNVLGSNVCNIALVLGITAFIFPIVVNKNSIRIDWPMMFVATLLLFFFILDLTIVWWEGLIFVTILLVFGVWTLRKARKEALPAVTQEVDDIAGKDAPAWQSTLFIILGSTALVFGADWFVSAATDIAKEFGVSDRVIGLSMVAFGTSIPEIITSIIAAFKKETDISLGNLIGSNIFNILSILGITAMIQSIQVDRTILQQDIYWVLGISLLLLPLMLWRKKLGRIEGVILITVYAVYMWTLL